MSTALGLGATAVLGLVGLAVTLWFFWPAFKGSAVARHAIGTHRLTIGALVAVIVLNGIISLPIAGALHIERGFTATSFAVAALSTQIPMLIVVYVRLILPGAVTWTDLGLRPLPLTYIARVGLAAGLVGLVFIDVLELVLSQAGLRPNQIDQFRFVLTEGPAAFMLVLISAGLVAPVIEEVFFRGFVFGLYRRRQPLWMAYVVSSLLFTLLHLDPTSMNVSQMAGLSIGIFLLAVLLAWLYEHTGSLYPGMVAHAVNNASGLVLFYALSGVM